VATRTGEGGQALCLVKWRGLEYDKATWEPRQELEEAEGEREALDKVGAQLPYSYCGWMGVWVGAWGRGGCRRQAACNQRAAERVQNRASLMPALSSTLWLQFERRMALRVERDAAAEASARKAGGGAEAGAVALEQQPAWVDSAGTLKDYQLEGECSLCSCMACVVGMHCWHVLPDIPCWHTEGLPAGRWAAAPAWLHGLCCWRAPLAAGCWACAG
jgi:hypothetical protein